MTFMLGLSSSLKALAAARLGIETASQNVANANTEGYTRQRILQSASSPFTTARGFNVGTGVEVQDIQRLLDDGLNRRIRLQFGTLGDAEVDFNRWREFESVFNEPNGGLSNNLSDFVGTVTKLQTDPTSQALRGGMIQGARSMTDGFNLLATRLGEIQGNSFLEVQGHLRQINQLASGIADLNRQIISLEGRSSTANDLRDTRDQMLKDISRLMDTTVFERNSGSMDVLVGGQLLVSGDRSSQLRASQGADGITNITVGNSRQPIAVTNGLVAGLLRHEQTEIPALVARLDRMARNMALELNRIHSTGVPLDGSFASLRASNAATDTNGTGSIGDELLSDAGLPFDIVEGELYVTVTNKTDGTISRTRLDIKPNQITLQDFATTLSNIPRLNATVDPTGRLRVQAESGFGFDFSNRLDTKPNTFGSFGGDRAVVGSSQGGPFNLTVPSSMTVTVNGAPTTVNFTAAQFENPTQATAEEVVAAINTALGSSGEAKVVGNRFVIRSATTGSTATLQVANGTGNPATALRLPLTATTGSDSNAVDVTVSGSYSGSDNGFLAFVPDGNGRIGVTPGLTIGVLDKDGRRIATLDAGPNTQLLSNDGVEVLDGIKVSMTPGDINQTDGDVFAIETLADTDSSDILVALGLNSFLTGSTAADLGVNSDLENTPSLLSAGLSGAAGDGRNLERMMSLRSQALTALDGNSFEDFYNKLVGDVGFESSGARVVLSAEDQLLGALENQRESISGVNLDEEMVNLTRYQQAFQAASRVINVVNELANEVINIAR